MSGFEHYQQELAALDHEIRHYAAICGVGLDDTRQIENSLRSPEGETTAARQTLRGLLALRIKLEIELAEQGFVAPPLTPRPTV